MKNALAIGVFLAAAVIGLRAQGPPPAVVQWGLPGDVPMAGDFDGDGQNDLVVWRPANGTWYLRLSSTRFALDRVVLVQWGLRGDVPLAGDYDGDGITDLAVWRPSTGTWFVAYSGSRPKIVDGFGPDPQLSGTALAFTVRTGAEASTSGTVAWSGPSRRCVASMGPEGLTQVGVRRDGNRVQFYADPEVGAFFPPFSQITAVCQ